MIYLKPITETNWREAIRLKVAPEQQHFIASNVYSIAESKFDYYDTDGTIWRLTPLAIYADDAMVGFAMFGLEQTKQWAGHIARFMIDVGQQGKGYGKVAFKSLLARMLADAPPTTRYLEISYHPDNQVARNLYAKFGFVETGDISDGEVMARYVIVEDVLSE
ncbi:MAG: GNAT family N-acetyltransferase [Anaerolineae bacterium]|nr:GNAT family N-acetyltransferase [Anaerolineae bacterium]